MPSKTSTKRQSSGTRCGKKASDNEKSDADSHLTKVYCKKCHDDIAVKQRLTWSDYKKLQSHKEEKHGTDNYIASFASL